MTVAIMVYLFAKILWEGNECLAMRWNIARREWDDPNKISNNKDCVGMPSSHGYPVWFVLPEEVIGVNSALYKAIESGLKGKTVELSPNGL